MKQESIFKPLHFFYLAANSLVAAGLLTKNNQEPLEWLFLMWAGFTGIFLTYRFNDFIDADAELRFDYKKFLKDKAHLIVILQLIFILTPLSFIYLSEFRVYILAIAGFLGFLYSVKIEVGSFTLRLKHIFVVKNLLIGLCWGALVLVGADQIETPVVQTLFIFTSIQVFIGSTIRDLTDIDKDTQEYVNSLPVVMGFNNTIKVLAMLNFLALIFVFIYLPSSLLTLPYIVTFLWRKWVLFKLGNPNELKFWSQRMNLLTCFIIFIGQFFIWLF